MVRIITQRKKEPEPEVPSPQAKKEKPVKVVVKFGGVPVANTQTEDTKTKRKPVFVTSPTKPSKPSSSSSSSTSSSSASPPNDDDSRPSRKRKSTMDSSNSDYVFQGAGPKPHTPKTTSPPANNGTGSKKTGSHGKHKKKARVDDDDDDEEEEEEGEGGSEPIGLKIKLKLSNLWSSLTGGSEAPPEKGKGKEKEKGKAKAAATPEPPTKSPRIIIKSPEKKEKTTKTNGQEAGGAKGGSLLSALVQQLHKLDHLGFFEEPPTDKVAPLYSQLITHPMAFNMMQARAKRGGYTNVDDVEHDFHLICDNCITYNPPETIWNKDAHRLRIEGDKVISSHKKKMSDTPAKKTAPAPASTPSSTSKQKATPTPPPQAIKAKPAPQPSPAPKAETAKTKPKPAPTPSTPEVPATPGAKRPAGMSFPLTNKMIAPSPTAAAATTPTARPAVVTPSPALAQAKRPVTTPGTPASTPIFSPPIGGSPALAAKPQVTLKPVQFPSRIVASRELPQMVLGLRQATQMPVGHASATAAPVSTTVLPRRKYLKEIAADAQKVRTHPATILGGLGLKPSQTIPAASRIPPLTAVYIGGVTPSTFAYTMYVPKHTTPSASDTVSDSQGLPPSEGHDARANISSNYLSTPSIRAAQLDSLTLDLPKQSSVHSQQALDDVIAHAPASALSALSQVLQTLTSNQPKPTTRDDMEMNEEDEEEGDTNGDGPDDVVMNGTSEPPLPLPADVHAEVEEAMRVDGASLSTEDMQMVEQLRGAGVDVDFIKDAIATTPPPIPTGHSSVTIRTPQAALDHSFSLLVHLQLAQYERAGATPTTEEVRVAGQVASHIGSVAVTLPPSVFVSKQGIKRMIGLSGLPVVLGLKRATKAAPVK
eukprot:TRINITY_DN7990_c0_g1_i6.p1 TRINITY_DN7990_c0_g1~~TRINITY_DN7990_c0_g1_i6.p1  ORF type:complete len:875 (+),score=296.09 TRINITY_DN7990_c0_g1_i6:205-2829(+)